MNTPTCKDCRYYLPHYTLADGELFSVYCGHCRKTPPRTKKPDKAACEHFEQGEPVTKQFVRKEYLSKRLLEHVLNMELLPAIDNETEIKPE